MTHVVTENCICCRYTDCVETCPVACFYLGATMLVINPDECIDCGVCVPACPVDAIVEGHDPRAAPWLERNRRYATSWPRIDRRLAPLNDAEAWKDREGKAALFAETPGSIAS